jgi:uncharacterized protein YdeI (YjbR/CyaY-like superfamily)
MGRANPKAEVFYARQDRWRAELAALRGVLRDSGLCEDFKWRSPVYTHDGHNVALVWGFKDHAALGFFKGVLLADKAGILVAQGENSRSTRVVKVTSVEEVRRLAPTLADYLAEAIGIEKAGLKVDLPKDDLDYPAELVDRLDGDDRFRTAFEALTPGRRRSWVLHVSQAKQSKTRVSRIDKAAEKIFAGKGLNDR